MIDPLIKKALSIAHMTYASGYPADVLEREARQVQEFKSFSLRMVPEEQQDIYDGIWMGRCIFNWSGNSFDGLKTVTKDEEAQMKGLPKPTELAELMPETIRVIKDIGGQYRMVRMMRITAGRDMRWHSHALQYRQPLWVFTAHLPLIMPQAFRFKVVHKDYTANRGDGVIDLLDPSKVIEKFYPPGEVNIFNSYHPHAVTNPSNEDRVSLMMYLPINVPSIRKKLTEAIRKYDGPLLRGLS